MLQPGFRGSGFELKKAVFQITEVDGSYSERVVAKSHRQLLKKMEPETALFKSFLRLVYVFNSLSQESTSKIDKIVARLSAGANDVEKDE